MKIRGQDTEDISSPVLGSDVKVKKRREPLPAKLTPPTLSSVVERTRLFKLLDTAMQNQVVWLHAQAGAGKTTLVASYLSERKIKPLWYQIDARDADPATLFAYLRQAIGRLAPRKRETLPLLSPEYGLGLHVFARNFFEQLFARMRTPAVLVLDNYQDVAESAPVHDLLAQAISVLPQDAHIICISRADAPSAFARARAARQLISLGADSLTLTSEEARQIGASFAPGLPDHEVLALNERAGGWAAGLILLLEQSADSTLLPADDSNEHVFDFFSAEVMHLFEAEVQVFLSQSALFPVMDAALTAGLTGKSDAADILRSLVRRNYFIVRRPGKAMRYEFHPLFRDYLLSELRHRTSPETLRALQQRAGNLLVQIGEYDTAVDLLLAAEDFDGLTALIINQAENLVAEGRYQTLTQWLLAMPVEIRGTHPWLVYWLGISQMPFNPIAAREHFEQAYKAFDQNNDVAGLYLSWAGIADSFVLMWDDFSELKVWLEKYRTLRKTHPSFPSTQIEAIVQSAVFGALLYVHPFGKDFDEARKSVEAMVHVVSNPDFLLKMICNLTICYTWMGDFEDKRGILKLGRSVIEREEVTPIFNISITLFEGGLEWMTGNIQKSLASVATAQHIAEQSGVHFMDAVIQSQNVYAYGVSGDASKMEASLNRFRELLSAYRRVDVAHYNFQLGWCLSLNLNYKQALIHARQSLDVANQLSACAPLAYCQIGLAKALVHSGEYEEAYGLLSSVIEFASNQLKSDHFKMSALVILAYSWLKQGKLSECKTILQSAFGIGAQFGYITTLCMDHRILSKLCSHALLWNIEQEYTHALIIKWHLTPDQMTSDIESWPWPIKLYTLGSFSLIINGIPYSAGKKTPRKPFELLKLLVCRDGEIGIQEASNILWSEYDGLQAQNSLKATINRLRKIIGKESLLQKAGRLLLNKEVVWADIWAFDTLIKAIDSETLVDKACAFAHIHALYQGTLLPEDDLFWVIHKREHTQHMYVSALAKNDSSLQGQNVLPKDREFHNSTS